MDFVNPVRVVRLHEDVVVGMQEQHSQTVHVVYLRKIVVQMILGLEIIHVHQLHVRLYLLPIVAVIIAKHFILMLLHLILVKTVRLLVREAQLVGKVNMCVIVIVLIVPVLGIVKGVLLNVVL